MSFLVPSAASASSPRAASDLEQARPQTSGEEELQLQLALAMSREESQKVKQHTHKDVVICCTSGVTIAVGTHVGSQNHGHTCLVAFFIRPQR